MRLHGMLRYKDQSVQDSKRQAETCPKESRSRGPRDFANRQEAVVGTPAVVEPIEAEAALRTILDEKRHAAAAIDLANGAESDDRILPLSIGVFGPICQEVFGLPRHPRILAIGPVDQVERVFRRNVPVGSTSMASNSTMPLPLIGKRLAVRSLFFQS